MDEPGLLAVMLVTLPTLLFLDPSRGPLHKLFYWVITPLAVTGVLGLATGGGAAVLGYLPLILTFWTVAYLRYRR